MRKVLTTFGFGGHAELLDVALPTFRWYAERHGYDLFVPSESMFAGVERRPHAWMKLPLLSALLRGGYGAVLWLDCDVVIKRYDRDILDDAGPEPMALVVQETPDGRVPSTGVWLLRPEALETIDSLWPRSGFLRSSGWWEQAALIDALGGDPDAAAVRVPPGPLWSELPYHWNPHVRDARGIPGDCRFFHATMFADRRAAMLENAGVPE
jgi:hypothetical protein